MDAPTLELQLEPLNCHVRAEFNGLVVADSSECIELLEGDLAPVVYFPRKDVRMELLERTAHTTYCPFKGNASYWSIRAGERVARDVIWSYERPYQEAEGLRDYMAFYVDRLDGWYVDDCKVVQEAERVEGPYLNPLLSWVLTDAPFLEDPRALTEGLARQMIASGMPLWRLHVVVRTLHPQILGHGYRYAADSGAIESVELPHEVMNSPEYLNSPLVPLWEGVGGLRRRLDLPEPVLDYPVLEDLHAEGATDYVAMPLVFSDGQLHAITLSATRPGGFTTRELGHLYEVLAVLARLYEAHVRRDMALNLLDTYLGHKTGERVLNGQIKRGDGDDIRAIIWFCDLRASSELAESMDRHRFLATLNDFFDCLAGAVLAHGGEVLRFIGDAALAIFPLEGTPLVDGVDCQYCPARQNALAAAAEARERIAVLNERRAAQGEPPLRFGIGLHEGDLTYGNIGTDSRLEFTVIGEAANFAARIESMSKDLGVTLVVSEAFVEQREEHFRSLGTHTLRGIHGAHELFTYPGFEASPQAAS